MKYGHFDDERREYVIETPQMPSPWINYLGCEKFFSLFSQTGGGYCFYGDSRLRRITRYRDNNIPADSNGRYFYVRDEADAEFWAVGYMPVKRPVDHFECRHGLGYSRIVSRRKELISSLPAFVPLGADCEDPRLRRMVNTWNPYQCMVTFNLSRSASYYESGISRGMGFRDCNQDLLGVVHMVPDRARQRILDLAATQFPDGSAFHQYQPLTKRGNYDIGNGFNDDPLWLLLAVCEYVKETGDSAILEEAVPFHQDSDNQPLLEHLRRAFNHVVQNRGPHGLPLIGRADWNDCLNLNCFSTDPDEPFQSARNVGGSVAESVLVAGMFVFIGGNGLRPIGVVRLSATSYGVFSRA